MAVLTDILVAPESDVPAIILQWPGTKSWAALESTGLDGIMLSELADALGDSKLAEEIAGLGPASFADEVSGPWVYVLPFGFRDQIADLPAPELEAMATAWAEREEAKAMGLSPQVAASLLSEIHSLAIAASKSGQPLLLWISL